MSDEPNTEESASSTRKAAASKPAEPKPHPDPHEAVLNAARDAEQAVANSAQSVGLGRNK